ncbi:transposable element Tcb2 transposase [Trichonephila clavipes]|nr:transposable element Tcb2 transposase [Trichonephila clavipes]
MSLTRRPDSGCPRQTSLLEDRHIVRNARVQPTASSAAIQAHVAPSLVAPVSSRTIRRRLAEGHLGSRRPLAEWNHTVFSDESTFNLSSDDNRVCVWRPCGERLNPAFALQRHTAPTAGMMVWGAIAYNTRLPLVLICGAMTAQRYVHDILQPHMLPHMQRLSHELFFIKTMFGLIRQGCHKTVSALLLPFLGLSDLQICLHSSISGIIWDGEFGIPRV